MMGGAALVAAVDFGHGFAIGLQQQMMLLFQCLGMMLGDLKTWIDYTMLGPKLEAFVGLPWQQSSEESL